MAGANGLITGTWWSGPRSELRVRRPCWRGGTRPWRWPGFGDECWWDFDCEFADGAVAGAEEVHAEFAEPVHHCVRVQVPAGDGCCCNTTAGGYFSRAVSRGARITEDDLVASNTIHAR